MAHGTWQTAHDTRQAAHGRRVFFSAHRRALSAEAFFDHRNEMKVVAKAGALYSTTTFLTALN